jgi:hypothetical protein
MQMRSYALILIGVLLAGCMVYLTGQLVLYRSSETMSFDAVIEHQRANDGLYFGLANPTGYYKLAAYGIRKPDILILGSSRAHREHQEFYNRSSYAMSGLVLTPDTAIQVLDLALPIHKPKIVIFNVDFFSFCSLRPFLGAAAAVTHPSGAPPGPAWQQVNHFAIVPRLVSNGFLSPRDLADFAVGRFDDAAKGIPLYGLIAIKRHLGFRLDGAVSEINERMQNVEDFESAKQEIITGTRHYPAGCYYDPTAMAYLKLLQHEMDQAGIKLVLMLPPIAPSAYRLFMVAPADISGYYKTAQQEMAKQGFADLHVLVDGGAIGAPDSEFADAVHGGDISEARMLLKAAQAPGTVIAEIIDRPFLERLIRERPGVLVVEMSYFQAADAAARNRGGTTAMAPP